MARFMVPVKALRNLVTPLIDVLHKLDEKMETTDLECTTHQCRFAIARPVGGELPDDIKALIANAIDAFKLKILVFGPQVHTPSAELRTAKLQSKRIEIRGKLEGLGHHVKYAEDLVDHNLDGPAGNMFFQELVIMKEYDLIVTIVDSPGSIAEATAIALKPALAQKASLFLDSDFVNGLVGAACRNAKDIGAHFETYTYPTDLDDCHLFGYILDRVSKLQKVKYLL